MWSGGGAECNGGGVFIGGRVRGGAGGVPPGKRDLTQRRRGAEKAERGATKTHERARKRGHGLDGLDGLRWFLAPSLESVLSVPSEAE